MRFPVTCTIDPPTVTVVDAHGYVYQAHGIQTAPGDQTGLLVDETGVWFTVEHEGAIERYPLRDPSGFHTTVLKAVYAWPNLFLPEEAA